MFCAKKKLLSRSGPHPSQVHYGTATVREPVPNSEYVSGASEESWRRPDTEFSLSQGPVEKYERLEVRIEMRKFKPVDLGLYMHPSG